MFFKNFIISHFILLHYLLLSKYLIYFAVTLFFFLGFLKIDICWICVGLEIISSCRSSSPPCIINYKWWKDGLAQDDEATHSDVPASGVFSRRSSSTRTRPATRCASSRASTSTMWSATLTTHCRGYSTTPFSREYRQADLGMLKNTKMLQEQERQEDDLCVSANQQTDDRSRTSLFLSSWQPVHLSFRQWPFWRQQEVFAQLRDFGGDPEGLW